MIKRGVVIFGILILVFSVYVNAYSICESLGGQCYWTGDLGYPPSCPGGQHMISGDTGANMCFYIDLPGIGGDAILDITGMMSLGDTCCLPWFDPTPCGNGVREGYEQCDGADFGEYDSDSCEEIAGFPYGELICTEDCEIDTSDCYDVPIEYEEPRLRLIVNTLNEQCPYTIGDVNIILLNDNFGYIEDVYIYDTVFWDSDCDGYNGIVYTVGDYLDYSNLEFSCGDVENNGNCQIDYEILLIYSGCYYHDIFVSSGQVDYFTGG